MTTLDIPALMEALKKEQWFRSRKGNDHLLGNAVNVLEALTAENEKLRAALRGGAEMLATMGNGEGWTIQSVIDHLASADALATEGDG